MFSTFGDQVANKMIFFRRILVSFLDRVWLPRSILNPRKDKQIASL